MYIGVSVLRLYKFSSIQIILNKIIKTTSVHNYNTDSCMN